MTALAPAPLAKYTADALDRPILGHAAMFSVHQMRTPHWTITDILKGLDLEKYCPKAEAPSDTYRKVSNAMKASKQPIAGTDRYVNVLVRQVADDDREIHRQIVIEEVDERGKRLRYDAAISAFYSRSAQRTHTRRLPGYYELDPQVQQYADTVARNIVTAYEQSKGTVDETAVRSVVNKVLQDHQAILLRPTGGVYFVASDPARDDAIEKLKKLAKAVPQVDFYALPLVNTDEQREMVEKEASLTGLRSRLVVLDQQAVRSAGRCRSSGTSASSQPPRRWCRSRRSSPRSNRPTSRRTSSSTARSTTARKSDAPLRRVREAHQWRREVQRMSR